METGVKYVRNLVFRPRPNVESWAALNALIITELEADLPTRHVDDGRSAEEAWTLEREHLRAMPVHRPATCRVVARVADKFGHVRVDHVTYSVPIRHAYRPVWVKRYHDRVAVAVGAEVVAQHRRAFCRGSKRLDPRHVLELLERKHRAVPEATALRGWQLAPVWQQVRAELARHTRKPDQEWVRMLRLMETHPAAAVERAVAVALERHSPRLETVRLLLRQQQAGPPHCAACARGRRAPRPVPPGTTTGWGLRGPPGPGPCPATARAPPAVQNPTCGTFPPRRPTPRRTRPGTAAVVAAARGSQHRGPVGAVRGIVGRHDQPRRGRITLSSDGPPRDKRQHHRGMRRGRGPSTSCAHGAETAAGPPPKSAPVSIDMGCLPRVPARFSQSWWSSRSRRDAQFLAHTDPLFHGIAHGLVEGLSGVVTAKDLKVDLHTSERGELRFGEREQGRSDRPAAVFGTHRHGVDPARCPSYPAMTVPSTSSPDVATKKSPSCTASFLSITKDGALRASAGSRPRCTRGSPRGSRNAGRSRPGSGSSSHDSSQDGGPPMTPRHTTPAPDGGVRAVVQSAHDGRRTRTEPRVDSPDLARAPGRTGHRRRGRWSGRSATSATASSTGVRSRTTRT